MRIEEEMQNIHPNREREAGIVFCLESVKLGFWDFRLLRAYVPKSSGNKSLCRRAIKQGNRKGKSLWVESQVRYSGNSASNDAKISVTVTLNDIGETCLPINGGRSFKIIDNKASMELRINRSWPFF